MCDSERNKAKGVGRGNEKKLNESCSPLNKISTAGPNLEKRDFCTGVRKILFFMCFAL